MPRKTQAQIMASYALWLAIFTGQIPRAKELVCIDCGNPAREYDHYLGYTKEHWLDVEPVCSSCHKKRGWARGEYKRKRIGPRLENGRFEGYGGKRNSPKMCEHDQPSIRSCRECRKNANALYARTYRRRLAIERSNQINLNPCELRPSPDESLIPVQLGTEVADGLIASLSG